MDFHKTFPFPTERPIQTKVLDNLNNNWDKYKFHLLQLPTGTGKSPIAIAISQALEEKSIISTPQKILQDQYMRDFGKRDDIFIKEVKGRANFQCVTDPDCTCADGPGAINHKSCPDCPYISQKKAAVGSKCAIMNFAYYISTSFGIAFADREVLILDEAHNLPEQIIDFAEIKITDTSLRRLFGNDQVKVPELYSLEEYGDWLRDIWDTLDVRIKAIEKIFKKVGLKLDTKEQQSDTAKQLKKDYDKFVSFAAKIERYFKTSSDVEWIWSFEQIWSKVKGKKKPENAFIMKPLEVSHFAQSIIFDKHEKVVLMSATLLNKERFCKNLGINPQFVNWVEAESPFPEKNHQFLLHSVGSLNQKEIDRTLPKLMPVVEQILRAHKGQKGIIHTNSFKITNFLRENVKNDRLLIQEQGQANAEVYGTHKKAKSDTVLVSPSMAEGIDLIGDLGQFQIIMKLPFLYLGDKWVKTKATRDEEWYGFKMILTLVQAMGRIQRTEQDQCITYCLDPAFNFFVKKKYQKYLPKHIKNIIG